MSEIENRFVRRGVWTNYDKGSVMGKTITTDTQSGTLIIALLAVFTTLGMTHLFHLCSFFYHQARANGRPLDGLFRQQQALLRTLPGPGSLMADSLKLWFSWRHTSKKALLRTLPQAILALIFAVASISTSILSSYVISSTDLEVLVKSPLCGHLNVFEGQKWTGGRHYEYLSTIATQAELYAEDCYNDKESLPARCRTFARTRIPFRTETVDCPFSEGLCSSPALSFDSGLFDFGKAYGFNLKGKDEVKYRRRDTCAPLITEGHVSERDAADLPSSLRGGRDAFPGEKYLHYSYGADRATPDVQNMTFGLSYVGANVSKTYDLLGKKHFARTAESSWQLPNEMNRTDGDVLLALIVKNAVKYLQPINDPIFAANNGKNLTNSNTGENVTWYLSDTPATPIGCVTQHQWCIPSKSGGDHCTELSGVPDVPYISEFPEASDIQKSVLKLSLIASYVFDIDLRTKPWVSKFSDNGFMITHPDSLGMSELTAWMTTTWAANQLGISDYALGPKTRFPEEVTRNPETDGDRTLCGSQKMRKSGGFVNVNYFGLVFILTIASVVTVLDLVLLRVLIFLKAFRKFLSPRINRWLQDGVWQLQRQAYEAQADFDWVGCEKEIPTTRTDSMLPDLATQIKSEKNFVTPSIHEPATPDTPSEKGLSKYPDMYVRESTINRAGTITSVHGPNDLPASVSAEVSR